MPYAAMTSDEDNKADGLFQQPAKERMETESDLREALIARHPCGTWDGTATVASFRTWRGLQPSIAQDPAINAVRKFFPGWLSGAIKYTP